MTWLLKLIREGGVGKYLRGPILLYGYHVKVKKYLKRHDVVKNPIIGPKYREDEVSDTVQPKAQISHFF